MKILFFADPMGSLTGDETVEDEAKYCKDLLLEHGAITKKDVFETTIDSMKPEEDTYDVLIFDFGGLGFGATGMIDSLSMQLLHLIENRPGTLFVAWTTFTNQFLQDACEKELGKFNNLIARNMMDSKSVIEKIRVWSGRQQPTKQGGKQ